MTLMQMRYFVEVCRHENVTRAAEVLHVSQPSVSSAIRNLEAELGVPLFHRVRLRLTLTHEGEIFRREAADILERTEQLEQRMRELGTDRKLVHIGIPPMVGTILFPPMLISFQKLHPDVQVEIREHGSLTCWEQVAEEKMDLAIVITNGMDSARLNCLPMMDTRLVFCVSARHLLAAKPFVTPADCCSVPQVLLPGGSYNRAIVRRMYDAAGLRPNVLLYSSQLYTIERLLQEQAAGAFLFQDLAERMPGIAGIPVEPTLEPIHIGLIWKRNATLFADVTHFIEFARGYAESVRSGRDIE